MQQLLHREALNGYAYRPVHLGMGDVSTGQVVQVAGSTAGAAATAVIGSIAASGGTILGLAASSLIPVVGPIIAGLTIGIQALVANSGCGVTCVETSQWANQAAAKLQQILDAYFALPAPRTQAQQAVALANFDTVWQALQQQCGQPGTGDAGVRCITDRQAGACTWRQKYAPVYPGEPAIGECWNWFNGYRDPIANDPTVPDPVDSATQAVDSAASSVGSAFSSIASSVSGMSPLLLIGGGILALAFLGGDN